MQEIQNDRHCMKTFFLVPTESSCQIPPADRQCIMN
jgi:hypothetical protein